MTRKKAREIALHLIFEMGFREFDEECIEERLDWKEMDSLKEEVETYGETPDDAQFDYIREAVKGVAGKKDEIDKEIEKYAKGWKLSRISRMTLAIMRLAVYEMRYVEDVPVRAAINEAVNLAKAYDSEEAPKFINGILGSVARNEQV